MLSECLGEAGYVTQLIADTPHLMNNGHFFDRGFQGWCWIRGQEIDRLVTGANYEIELPGDPAKYRNNGAIAIQYIKNAMGRRTETDWYVAQTMMKACEWLEDNYKADKFFLWVDTFDPHEPWDPPQWYVDLYDPGYEGDVITYPNYADCDFLTEAELRHCHALYCGKVTLVDKWVGFLLEKIKTLGLVDNTAIIFTSDHGCYHGEHDKIGKHSLTGKPWPLYEELIHIPLIVYLPGRSGGQRCPALVQPPDLMPTILELCGVEAPDTIYESSFVPLLRGEDRKLREVTVSCKDRMMLHAPITISDQEWSLVLRGKDPPELYNLQADPQQERNLFEFNHKKANQLWNEMVKMLESCGWSDSERPEGGYW